MIREINKEELTAFALGELAGKAAKEVEEFIAANPAAKRYVEETRLLKQLAETDLRAEPLPGGRGAEPIFREIRQRAGTRSVRKQWIQAIALGAVIVLFVLAIPLRKNFEGNVAGIFGHKSVENSPVGDEEKLTHRTVKEDPKALTGGLESLLNRPRSPHATADCRLALPDPGAAENIQEEQSSLAATYFLTESNLQLDVKVRSAPQPLLHEAGVFEVARTDAFTLFRRTLSEQSVVFYVVPHSDTEPYCSLQVGSDWLLTNEQQKALGISLEELAQSLAAGMAVVHR